MRVYWFEGQDGAVTVLVVSGNLTRGGLMTNLEVSMEAKIPGAAPEEELVGTIRGFLQELTEST
jgi:hypothetical protein